MNTPLLSVNGGPMLPMKKTRALPHVWKRYWSLGVGEAFYLGSVRYRPNSIFSYHPETDKSGQWLCDGDGKIKPGGRIKIGRFIWPWTRVRTAMLIRYSGPSYTGRIKPRVASIEVEIETQGDDLTRLPQPHSDNSVSGPTS